MDYLEENNLAIITQSKARVCLLDFFFLQVPVPITGPPLLSDFHRQTLAVFMVLLREFLSDLVG